MNASDPPGDVLQRNSILEPGGVLVHDEAKITIDVEAVRRNSLGGRSQVRNSPEATPKLASISYGEALPNVSGVFQFIDHGDCIILDRNPALTVCID